MRTVLERIVIDAFGPFSQLSIPLADGLSVLSGPNEAGKSTTLAFVRGVLFGFARKGGGGSGGDGGQPASGELHLRAGKRRLIVRRVARPRRADGELSVLDEHRAPLPEAALWDALGHVSEPLFRQVFAFTLDELNALAVLDDESQVAQALFAVGMQGARRLPDATAALDRERDAIYGARARNRPLNQLLKELEGLRLELSALDGQPERLAADVAQKAALDARLAQLDAEQAQAQAQLSAAEGLARAEPHLSALIALLGEPPAGVDAAPPDGAGAELPALAQAQARRARGAEAGLSPATVAAVDRIEGARQDAQEALERARLGAASLEAQLERVEAPAPATLRAVDAAVARRLTVEPLADRLSARRAALDERRRALADAVERSVPGRGAAELKALDVGAGVRSALTELAHARLEAQQRFARAQALHQEVSVRLETLEGVLAQRGPGDAGVEAVAAQRAILGRLAALRVERAALLAVAEPPAGRPPQDWVKGAALVGLAILVAVVLLAPPQVGVAAFFVGLAAAGAGLAWWLGERRHRQAAQSAQETQAAAHAQSLAKLEERWRAALASLGVASEEELPAAAARIEALDAQLARDRARREAAQDELVGARARKAAASTELAAAQATLDRIALAVDERLAPLGVGSMDPGRAVDLCLELGQLQERSALIAQEAAAVAHDQDAVDAADAALAQACVVAGLDAADGDPLGAAQRWLEDCRARGAERHALAARLAEVAGQAQGLADRLARLDGELGALLAGAGAADVAGLRRAHAERDAAERWATDVERQLEAARSAAGAAFAAGPWAGDAREAAARLAAAQAAFQKVHGQRSLVLAELGALTERIAAAQTDDTAHRLRSEEERVVAAIRRGAREYAVASYARALLDDARARFEAEHQPRVVQLASDFFVELTERRYTRVSVDLGARRLTVHGARGELLGPAQLSRGTRELLVLALHLAVVRDFAEQHVALPIVLDDVLVNLDPRRAERVAALLARLGQAHQVVVLTCHPWIRDACAQHGAASALLDPPTQLSLLSPS